MIYKRPDDLPYDGDLTWDNNGWFVGAEAAQMEDNNVLLTHYMQTHKDITNGDGTELEGERPLVKQTPKQVELLAVIQEMCGVTLKLNSYHPTINASKELVETLNEIISIKADSDAFSDPNRLYELFTRAAGLLAPLTQVYRAWVLPRIALPTEHLMMSSPFFQNAFEKHLAWHKHLDELHPNDMATDRELWWIREKIKKSYTAPDAPAALTAAIRLARDEKIPLGEGYITREYNRPNRLRNEAGWANDPEGSKPIREHGPTAVFRARLHFMASLGHEDEVQKLLKDAHGFILLGPKKIPTETKEQAHKRSSNESGFFKYLRLSPEERRASRAGKSDDHSKALSRQRSRKYAAKMSQKLREDPVALAEKRAKARARYQANKVQKERPGQN